MAGGTGEEGAARRPRLAALQGWGAPRTGKGGKGRGGEAPARFPEAADAGEEGSASAMLATGQRGIRGQRKGGERGSCRPPEPAVGVAAKQERGDVVGKGCRRFLDSALRRRRGDAGPYFSRASQARVVQLRVPLAGHVRGGGGTPLDVALRRVVHVPREGGRGAHAASPGMKSSARRSISFSRAIVTMRRTSASDGVCSPDSMRWIVCREVPASRASSARESSADALNFARG